MVTLKNLAWLKLTPCKSQMQKWNFVSTNSQKLRILTVSLLGCMYSLVVVLFNVCPAQVSLEIPALKSRTLQLHPLQLNSVDDVVKLSAYDASSGSFIIPRRTTSLFVELRNTWINLLFSLSLSLSLSAPFFYQFQNNNVLRKSFQVVFQVPK